MKIYSALQHNYDGLSSQKRVYDTHSLDKGSLKGHYKSAGAHILKENNSKDITRPTESVNFSGSAVLNGDAKETEKTKNFKKKVAMGIGVAAALITGTTVLALNLKKAGGGNLAKGIALNQKFYNAAAFSEQHEAFVKNAIALGLAGILKPICVLAMPGADEKDKQFTATKNMLSAFIGFGLTTAILGPVNYGVDRFMKNPQKYLPEGHKIVTEFQQALKKPYTIDITKKPKYTLVDRWIKRKPAPDFCDYYDSFKIVYKNALGLITAPLKAYLTIKAMPFILKVLFGNRKKGKENQEQPLFMQVLNQPNMIAKGTNDENIKKTFAMFSIGGEQ